MVGRLEASLRAATSLSPNGSTPPPFSNSKSQTPRADTEAGEQEPLMMRMLNILGLSEMALGLVLAGVRPPQAWFGALLSTAAAEFDYIINADAGGPNAWGMCTGLLL